MKLFKNLFTALLFFGIFSGCAYHNNQKIIESDVQVYKIPQKKMDSIALIFLTPNVGVNQDQYFIEKIKKSGALEKSYVQDFLLRMKSFFGENDLKAVNVGVFSINESTSNNIKIKEWLDKGYFVAVSAPVSVRTQTTYLQYSSFSLDYPVYQTYLYGPGGDKVLSFKNEMNVDISYKSSIDPAFTVAEYWLDLFEQKEIVNPNNKKRKTPPSLVDKSIKGG